VLSLTYFSTSSDELDKDALLDLLARTREKNESLGITGMLLYSDGSFVQTLEGPDDVVEQTFARIALDRRHRAVFVALRDEISERCFPTWSMGFREITKEESASVPGFNDYLDAQLTARHPDGGRAEVFHRAFRKLMP
jgi:hypothetical protein